MISSSVKHYTFGQFSDFLRQLLHFPLDAPNCYDCATVVTAIRGLIADSSRREACLKPDTQVLTELGRLLLEVGIKDLCSLAQIQV